MKNPFSINITSIQKSYHFLISPRLYRFIITLLAVGFLTVGGLIFSVPYLYSLVDEQQRKIASTKDINLSLSISNRYLYDQLNDNKEQFDRLYVLINSIQIDDFVTQLTNNGVFNPIDQNKQERATMLRLIPNGYPTKQDRRISSSYGYRVHPVRKTKNLHRGIDIAARIGTPVYATADGMVKFVGERNGYGKTLTIQHKYGFKTLFAHLSAFKIKKGMSVRRGQLIALSGKSGLVTGPHVHYEIRFNKNYLNPRKFIQWDQSNYSAIFNDIKSVPWQFLTNLIRIQLIQQKASSQKDALYYEGKLN